MRIEEIENLMDKFYDLESDVDDQVFEELQKFANSDKEGFIKYANSQKLGPSSYLPILYEAIMDHANGWESFLLKQIKFIIEQADKGKKDATYEISSIYYLTNISGLEKSFYSSAINFFHSKLNSKNRDVRKAALEYIIDLHFESKINLSQKLKKELQRQLNDNSFDVRLYAYLNLKDENLLPNGYKRSIFDRIRTWLSPGYRNYIKAKEIGQKVAEQVIKNDL